MCPELAVHLSEIRELPQRLRTRCRRPRDVAFAEQKLRAVFAFCEKRQVQALVVASRQDIVLRKGLGGIHEARKRRPVVSRMQHRQKLAFQLVLPVGEPQAAPLELVGEAGGN